MPAIFVGNRNITVGFSRFRRLRSPDTFAASLDKRFQRRFAVLALTRSASNYYGRRQRCHIRRPLTGVKSRTVGFTATSFCRQRRLRFTKSGGIHRGNGFEPGRCRNCVSNQVTFSELIQQNFDYSTRNFNRRLPAVRLKKPRSGDRLINIQHRAL